MQKGWILPTTALILSILIFPRSDEQAYRQGYTDGLASVVNDPASGYSQGFRDGIAAAANPQGCAGNGKRTLFVTTELVQEMRRFGTERDYQVGEPVEVIGDNLNDAVVSVKFCRDDTQATLNRNYFTQVKPPAPSLSP